MTTIDPTTVPPKMSRIERLMKNLELQALSQGSSVPSEDHTGKVAAEARDLILNLLGMSEKPKGEQIYAHWLKAARAMDSGGPPGLRETLLFITRFNEDTFPASEDGKIPFGRALLEMAIDAIRAELKRQESAVSAIDHRELLRRYIEHVGRCEGTDFITETWRGYSLDILNEVQWSELCKLALDRADLDIDRGSKPGDDGL